MWHAWREGNYVWDFCRKPNELEDLGTDGNVIIFQYALQKKDDKAWDDLAGSEHG
jgi:hypothetical protein